MLNLRLTFGLTLGVDDRGLVFLNLVEHSHRWNSHFSIWQNTVISRFLWNTVISQFGGTQSFLDFSGTQSFLDFSGTQSFLDFGGTQSFLDFPKFC